MTESFPLGLLDAGDIAEVVEMPETRSHGPERAKHSGQQLEDMGLRAGKLVKMLNNEGRGPLLVKVDESRMALARRWAMTIMVKRTRS